MRYQIGLGTVLSALMLTMLPVGAAAAPDNDRGQGSQHRSTKAQEALDDALSLFTDGRTSTEGDRRNGRTAPPRNQGTEPDTHHQSVAGTPEHASLVLRDLALRVDDLDPDDRERARRILARPDDGAPDPGLKKYLPDSPTAHHCSETARICVHWVDDPEQVEPSSAEEIDGDAPDLTDTDHDGVPDWVERNVGVFEEVWQRIVVEFGYRMPVPDGLARNHGPNGYTDIYLAELGRYGVYGYCTTDSPGDWAAYCVIDDDFAEFAGTKAGRIRSLRVTAAHEFFHAVQMAYRPDADFWVMEGTAAWIEDEVFDNINDNRQYLWRSALKFPYKPLDYREQNDHNWLYGSWIWWRYLTERFATEGARDPEIVRHLWNRLAWNGPAEGSMVAQRRVVSRRGGSFPAEFARFGAVSRVPHRWYDEGRTYRRYVAPARRFTLSRKRQDLGWKGTRLSHLSTQHAILRPGRGLAGPWKLRIRLDLPPRFRGSAATVVVHRPNGTLNVRRVKVDRRGNATVNTPFNTLRVSHVALSLTNASTRTADCGSKTMWSCGGRPLDDDLPFAFRAKTFRAG